MKPLTLFSVVMFTALSLTGCQTNSGSATSYVSVRLPASAASQLADDAAAYLSSVLPPARTTLKVALGKEGTTQDSVSPAILAALREKGYGVIVSEEQEKQHSAAGVPVRFTVSRLENGVLLRLDYGSSEATRFYLRTSDNQLTPASAFTVREVNC